MPMLNDSDNEFHFLTWVLSAFFRVVRVFRGSN